MSCLVEFQMNASLVNPLSANSDDNEISLSTCSNIQMMRIKKVITKDKMS